MSGMGYPSAALSCCLGAHGKGFKDAGSKVDAVENQHLSAKIARAMASGPRQITQDATVAEFNHDGSLTTLREGTNHWICFPGNENEIGNVPMCCDPMGFQYLKDYVEGKPAPTNSAPGLIYMLCGATQHSIVDPFDKTSPAIPIGPHYMIMWPFDSARDGIPNTARDAGAWVMFGEVFESFQLHLLTVLADKSPYSHLHVCGSPWEGNEYDAQSSTATWTLKYGSSK